MEGVRWWLMLGILAGVGGEKWRWPEERSATLKIDTKVHLVDDFKVFKRNELDQNDEGNFREALDTTGFYNRPRDDGRYPVKVESPLFDNGIKYKKTNLISQPGHVDLHRHNSDAKMEYLRYCKCLDSSECRQKDYEAVRSCGNGKTLCCYMQPNKQIGKASEYFNEGDDERPDLLLPGRSDPSGPFPPPPQYDVLTGGQPLSVAATSGPAPSEPRASLDRRQPVLIGPGGPTGVVGPTDENLEFVHKNRPLVNNPILGPTHIHHNRLSHHGSHSTLHEPHESAQRGVLVGPEGPTGILGPPSYAGQSLLVGPGGPTGMIGPPGYHRPQNSRYYQPPGILTGPRGPTGIIGPGQQILVGPGGPTGRIGPPNRSFFK